MKKINERSLSFRILKYLNWNTLHKNTYSYYRLVAIGFLIFPFAAVLKTALSTTKYVIEYLDNMIKKWFCKAKTVCTNTGAYKIFNSNQELKRIELLKQIKSKWGDHYWYCYLGWLNQNTKPGLLREWTYLEILKYKKTLHEAGIKVEFHIEEKNNIAFEKRLYTSFFVNCVKSEIENYETKQWLKKAIPIAIFTTTLVITSQTNLQKTEMLSAILLNSIGPISYLMITAESHLKKMSSPIVWKRLESGHWEAEIKQKENK